MVILFTSHSSVSKIDVPGNVKLTIRLSKKVNQPVMVDYHTTNATAKSKANKHESADYIEKRGTVTIPAGSQTATVSVIIIADNKPETPEQFHVQLSRPVNADIGKSHGTVTILDALPITKSVERIGSLQIVDENQQVVEGLIVKALPNPTNSEFTLKMESSNSKELLNLHVVDVLGRVVEITNNILAGQTLKIGKNYRPGFYFVEVTQGINKKQLKLIKLAD